MLRSWRKILLAVCLFALPSAAVADQNDRRLDELFGALQVVKTPHEARMVERVIWGVWLESGSDTVDLLMKQVLQAMNEERLDDALEVLDTVVELKPDYAEGWNKRATVYFLLGRYPESLSDVDRTLDLEPRHFGALSGLGMIFSRLDDDKRALDAYERALVVNPHLSGAKAAVVHLRKKVRGDKI